MAKKNHKNKTEAGLAAKDLPMTARADRWYSRIAFWLVAALVFFLDYAFSEIFQYFHSFEGFHIGMYVLAFDAYPVEISG